MCTCAERSTGTTGTEQETQVIDRQPGIRSEREHYTVHYTVHYSHINTHSAIKHHRMEPSLVCPVLLEECHYSGQAQHLPLQD